MCAADPVEQIATEPAFVSKAVEAKHTGDFLRVLTDAAVLTAADKGRLSTAK